MCIYCLNGAERSHAPFENEFGNVAAELAPPLSPETTDAPATTATPYEMLRDSTFEGSLSFAGDADAIAIWLEEGASYDIDLDGRTGGVFGALTDTVLAVLDGDGTQIARNDDAGGVGDRSSYLNFTADYTGWHYLNVRDFGDNSTGDYELSVYQRFTGGTDEDAHGDAPSGTNTDYFLSPGSEFNGAFSYMTDIDWVEVSLTEGSFYRAKVFGDGPRPISDPRLWLLDARADDILVLNYDLNGGPGRDAELIFRATYTGTAHLATRSQITEETGTYTLTWETFDPFSVTDPIDEQTDAPDNASTPYALDALEGETLVEFGGALWELDDVDWIGVDLVAGETYDFIAFGNTSHDKAAKDLFLQLLDSTGTLLVEDDDSAAFEFPAFTYTAAYSGRHYLTVSPSEFAPGAGVGQYRLQARNQNVETSPLDSINGQIGGLDIDDGVLDVFLALRGDSILHSGDLLPSHGFTDDMADAVMEALQAFKHITGIEVRRTFDADLADFQIARSYGDFAGRADFPNEDTAGSILLHENTEDYWTEELLRPGGDFRKTILHEAGHALGLMHPHDGGADSSVMRGVSGSGWTGEGTGFDLNQAPFTIMTYNDIWNGLSDPPARSEGVSGLATFGALDIAILQDLYGANEGYKSGNTTYRLTDNDWFEAIWDTGGMDTIRAGGFDDAVIDLTAATLDYSETGGGVVSYQQGAFGGFTIAAGVEIERGFGARGDDHITGNALDNHLRGSNGKDTLIGLDGADTLEGGRGLDVLEGGAGEDIVRGGAGGDTIFGNRSADTLLGNSGNDVISGGNGGDTLDGGRGHDVIDGGTGSDWMTGGSGADVFLFSDGDGSDTIDAFQDIDLIDLTAYGNGLTFAELTITAPSEDTATVTIAGSTTEIIFTDLRTTLAERHFAFDDLIG